MKFKKTYLFYSINPPSDKHKIVIIITFSRVSSNFRMMLIRSICLYFFFAQFNLHIITTQILFIQFFIKMHYLRWMKWNEWKNALHGSMIVTKMQKTKIKTTLMCAIKFAFYFICSFVLFHHKLNVALKTSPFFLL